MDQTQNICANNQCHIGWIYCGLYICDMAGVGGQVYCTGSNESETCTAIEGHGSGACEAHRCAAMGCDASPMNYCSSRVGLCACASG